MLQFEELRLRLEGLLPDIEDLAHAVGIKQMLARNRRTGRPGRGGRFLGRYGRRPKGGAENRLSKQKSNPITVWWPITTTP